MTAPHLAILADDLTGAADTAGVFARAGFRTVLGFVGAQIDDVDVLVRSTGSRGMDANAAAAANLRAALALQGLPAERRPHRVYKKIDSMLRGHPCEELAAVLAGLRERRALIAPALPAQGRTTVGSRQLMDGVPLDVTLPSTIAHRGDLSSLFACERSVPVHAVDLSTVRLSSALAALLVLLGGLIWESA